MIKLTTDIQVLTKLQQAFPTPPNSASRALAKYVTALEGLLLHAVQHGIAPAQRKLGLYPIPLHDLANKGGRIGPNKLRVHKWLKDNQLELVQTVEIGEKFKGTYSTVKLSSLVALDDRMTVSGAAISQIKTDRELDCYLNEFRLWLTRAMVRLTLGGLTELMTKAQVASAQDTQQAKAIADFKQETIKQQTAFTEFKPAQKLPLGDAPILVIRLRLGLEGMIYVVAFDLVNQKTITLKLDEPLFGKMRLLLNTIQEKAAWNLSALVADTSPEEKEPVSPSGGATGSFLH